MGFKSLGDILPKHVKKSGLGQQVEAVQLMDAFMKKAKEKWGQSVEGEMKPLYIKNKTLTIAMTNSSLAQELKLNEKEILDFLNKQGSDQVVERLRYLL